jgi:hypothetical protein
MVAALGSSSLAAWVTARTVRRQRRDDAVVADVRETQDRLQALRDACRRRALGDPTAPGPAGIASLCDALDSAAVRTLSDAVLSHAEIYAEAAALYAVRDPDSTELEEDAAYLALRDALRDALRRRR